MRSGYLIILGGRHIKKSTILLGAVIMAFSLTACGGSSDKPIQELELAEVETTAITSSDGRFSAEIPVDWLVLEPDEDAELQAMKEDSDGNLMYFALFAEDKKEVGAKFDTWKYGIRQDFRKDRDLPAMGDEIEIKINGRPAVQQTISEGTEESDVVQMTFIDGETYYGFIMCTSSSRDTYKDNEGVFNVIVTSAKGF